MFLQLIERDAAPIDTRWSAGFKTVGVEAKLLQGFSESFSSLLAGPASGHRLAPDPNAASQESTCSEYNRFGAVNAAEIGAHTRDAGGWALAGIPGFSAAVWIAFDLQTGHHRFAQSQVGGVLQQLQHLTRVLPFVGLGTQGPHGRAAAGVEDSLLDGCGISEAPNHAAESIHLVHQLAFGGSTHGRIAGLPGDAVEVEGKECCVQPQASSRDGGFTACMASSHDDHVEDFGGSFGGRHLFILQCHRCWP